MRLVKSEWVSQLTETGINAKLVMFNSQSKDLKGSVPWDNFSVETSFNSTVTQGWFLEILIFYSFLFFYLLHCSTCVTVYIQKNSTSFHRTDWVAGSTQRLKTSSLVCFSCGNLSGTETDVTSTLNKTGENSTYRKEPGKRDRMSWDERESRLQKENMKEKQE